MKKLLSDIVSVVGADHVLTSAAWRERATAWETHQPCNAAAVVRPASTDEVAAVLSICHASQQAVVPYGGLTNLVQACATTPSDIALSLERMNRVESVDVVGQTMTLQAGVKMQQAQEIAADNDLFFPVDIGARDTCMVGGNVSTNAGGTKVIRHGMMRDSVLGLEAVLSDGTVISAMNRFLKNNSGFDLKQLFIGTEGVLGLITRVVMRLETLPKSHNVALLGCDSYGDVLTVLTSVRKRLGASLCGFEVMWDNFVHNVVEPVGTLRSPVPPEHPFYVIVEAMGTNADVDDEQFQASMLELIENGLVGNGAIAKSDAERESIWAIRHEVEWVVRDAFVFDVSLPVESADEYVQLITAQIQSGIADARIAAFGHLGDNNIHISVLTDDRSAANAALAQEVIYKSLLPYQGAVSAEHGIGLEKREWLSISRSEPEIALMKTLKRALDPGNILNPGKVVEID